MNSLRELSGLRHIAVIGCGPRGLYCLDSLDRRIRDADIAGQFAVTVIEPSNYPGAGCIYNLNQPHHLRMNFATRFINAWAENDNRTDSELSLADWLARNYEALSDSDGYVPRAIVGKYLHDCFRRVLDRLRQVAIVNVVKTRARAIERVGDLWQIGLDGESFFAHEVMITVGHGGWRTTRMPENVDPRWIIDGVFPTEKQLSVEEVAPQSKVAVRGFGLTWIDAALSLTEGRGGTFHPREQRLCYEASGLEPAKIYPYSRTGRPMFAKPVSTDLLERIDPAIWESRREAIRQCVAPVTARRFASDIWLPIVTAAADALTAVSGIETTAQTVATWYEQWESSIPDSDVVVETMRQSVAIAYGNCLPDCGWALGEAWRQLYPALVDRISYGGLASDAWPLFKPIAAEMERIAFGPPAENIQRILALIDCGIVDLDYVNHSKLYERDDVLYLANEVGRIEIDKCVNAVIAAPTDLQSKSLLSSLLCSGTIERLNSDTGINVDEAGTPQSRTPLASEGLAILGRVTEGCILGNDTLSRKLHSHDRAWAKAVMNRVADGVVKGIR